MDKIDIINEYNLLKTYQKTNSNIIIRPFDSFYQSIINPEFVILKNNKYYKYSNSKIDEIQTDKTIPTTSSISFNNYNIFYVKNNGETHTIVNEDNLTYEKLTLKNAIRLTGNLSKKYIVKVSCGNSHALFLTHAGMLFSIGDNNLGQLGLNENEKIKETGEAIMIKDLLNYRIIDVCTGNNHSIAFGIIRDLSKQNSKDNKNDNNKDNIVFTWGDNSFGQCGIGDDNIKFVNCPSKLLINDKEIINEGVKFVSCGLNFSVLLLNNNKVFGFGDNQFHQLDLYSDNKKIVHPKELVFDYINNKNAKIVNLIVSAYSLLLVTDNRFLYIIGKNTGLGNEGKVIELENNIDKYIKIVLNDNRLTFFYYMINGEKKLVKDVKIDKKNIIKTNNSSSIKKKISMPKLINKDNNIINNENDSKPALKNEIDKSIKRNDTHNSNSSNEIINTTNTTNNNIYNSNYTNTNSSGISNNSNPSSNNNTLGNNNSTTNLASSINKNLNNKNTEKNYNNSKTPINNSRQSFNFNKDNSKIELKLKNNEQELNNNNNNINILKQPENNNEINQEIENQNEESPLFKKINKANSYINKREERKKVSKSNSSLNLSQSQNKNQINPLSNTHKIIQSTSTFQNIFNIQKTFDEEDENNRSVISEIGGFFSGKFSSIRKSFFKRRDISKENYFNDFCQNIFIYSQYKNQIKKYFYSGVTDKLRGKVWLKCLGNKFNITEDFFNIEYEKSEKLNLPNKIKKEIKLPFKYLGLFKENSPLTEDFYEIFSAFISCRPDIGIQKEISYLIGILLINMKKVQTYVSILNILLNPNIICYYINNDELIKKNCQIFKQIFLFNLPELCSFFELNNILPEEYFIIWNKTIFAKCFNIDVVMRIWDIYMIEGPRAIFEASCALLCVLYNDLMAVDDKHSILNILLNSEEKELNEEKIVEKMSKVQFPLWIKDEVKKMGQYLLPFDY